MRAHSEALPRTGVRLVVVLAGLVLAVVAAAKPQVDHALHVKFAVGTYVAKTAQGSSFRFTIEAHTATNHCGASASAYCFIDDSTPNFSWRCPGAPTTNAGVYPVPNGFVSTNGSFSYFQAAEDYNPLVSFKAHLSGSNVTGTMRQEQKVDTGGVTGTCDSGNISWTGHRVG